MKQNFILLFLLTAGIYAKAQLNPIITNWLINTDGTKGRYYLSGNPMPQTHTSDANVQQVSYSNNNVYVKATGVPAYVTGPYGIGTITVIQNNNYVIKLPLNPTSATVKTTVGGGAIAVFIDGSVAYRARDNATYNNQGQWHQNAVYFENIGFDCAHGHPGPMTSDYHVHQTPSAFNISNVPTFSICNVYLSDGLYVPDSTSHGPLIGFAADGYPIYGAYGYSNPMDPSSGIKRMVPGYKLRNITSRTTLPDGTAATGPTLTQMISSPLVNSIPLQAVLGAYEEDYEYITGYGDLDVYNGRFCITPEYPAGTYCYFATVDPKNNPIYPYIIGNKYYGNVTMGGPGSSFTQSTISETVTIYTPPAVSVTEKDLGVVDAKIFPNPTSDLLVIQSSIAENFDRKVELIDMQGKIVRTEKILQGSTMCYFYLNTVYSGTYFVRISAGEASKSIKVVVE